MNVIKPKRSNTVGFVPTTANLADGEFMFNTVDGIMFMRVGSTIKSFAFNANAYKYDLDSADFYQNGTTTVGSETVPKISLVKNSLKASLAADVAMATSNQWYDTVSLSLSTGTYLINAHITQVRTATTAETIYARITDGANHYASTQMYHGSVNGTGVCLHLTSIITLAATTTIKVQCSTSAGAAASLIKAAMTANGSGNNATTITAIRC